MASKKRRGKTGKKAPKKSATLRSDPKKQPKKSKKVKEEDQSIDVEPSELNLRRRKVASRDSSAASCDDPSSQEETSDEMMTQGSTAEQDDTDGIKKEVSKTNPGSLSLDVLAMVASEKLEKEPVYGLNKKLTLRNVQSMEVLNLDQIRLLSDKALVNLFADMTSNELKRNYTFTCYLQPNKCFANFSSFGNETRARQLVCSHLREHVEKIVKESEGAKVKFTAEPIHARKRRMTASKSSKNQKKKKGIASAKPSPSYLKPGKQDKNTVYTLLKSGKSTVVFPTGNIVEISDFMSSKNSKGKQKENDHSGLSKQTRLASQMKKNIAKKFAMKKSLKRQEKKLCDDEAEGSSSDSEREIDVENDDGKDPRLTIGEEVDTDKCIAVNDQFIIDLLTRSQPHHDHCYTTIFGKRRGAEMMHYEIESSEDESEEESSSRTSALKFNKHKCFPTLNKSLDRPLKVLHGCVQGGNNLSVPVIQYARLAFAPDGTPLVSAEEEVQDFNSNTIAESSSAQRPYPPMPKFELARKGKVFVPEEMIGSSGDEAERLLEHLTKRRQNKTKPKEGTAEWERKTALRCIRELRTKKKDDRVPLICKICKDKTFTAAATLMYHYRSHAGIKPFVCLICNTTFTRQHSLNYHMLIHNNQSRFTCIDCGRKFRHPSHFKEHIRRHTGECPFVCTDCPLKFKTRNTYKRHLKTRHGKLLTAAGIHVMTAEEFKKFQTKPYKKRVEVIPSGGCTIVEGQEQSVAETRALLEVGGKLKQKTVIITPEGQVSVIETGTEGQLMQMEAGGHESDGADSVDIDDEDDEDIDDGFSDASIDNEEDMEMEEDDELLDIT
ncbi:uncharacterized protein LOC135484220 [Lineus longissimus]|uniref:uncharacterized protein LOC135484220 n=1 Tax=Lineus longissimus TaxID=88925 RepID=UPI002B4FAE1C